MSSKCLAIVLNWNSAAYLPRCLEHLRAQSAEVQYLVVDNGSKDTSLDLLRCLPPDNVIYLPSNVGFADGMNVGITKAIKEGYEFVWLLNTDVFARPDCLSVLLERMASDSMLGMITPRLLSEDGSEQHAGGYVDWQTGQHTLLNASSLEGPNGDGAWLTGTAPLIRIHAIRASGAFHGEYFAYWEDVELSVRMKGAGFCIAAVSDAVATHVGSGSAGNGSAFVEYLQTRNRWLFLARNAQGGSGIARWLRLSAAAQTRAAMLNQLGKSRKVSMGLLAGLSAARQGRFGAPVSLDRLAWLERVCARHPWRLSGWMTSLANLFDPRSPLSRDTPV